MTDAATATTPEFRRPSRTVSGVLAGFLAGLLVAVVALPDHEDTEPSGVAALEAAAGSDPGGDVGGGVGAAAGTPAVTGAGSGAGPTGAAGATASGRQTGTPSGGAAASGAAVDNTKLPNGGATARGVTATEIKIGVGSIDPSLLAPICPACDPGQAKDGKPAEALIAAWTRDGILPVHGRTIKPVNRVIGLTPDEQRSACTYFTQEVKPFMIITGAGTSGTGQCAASEGKIPVLDGYGGYRDATLRQNYPLIHTIAPSLQRTLRNWVYWLEENGFLKGQTLGMYSYDDSVAAGYVGIDSGLDQAGLTENFRKVLEQKGYRLVVDFVANQGQEAAGVARFKAAGVTTAFAFNGSGDFQAQARQQDYHPKFPAIDLAYTFSDAQATTQFDPEEMHNELAMAVRWSPINWAQRKPATAADNPAANYCMKAYMDHTKRQLDSYENNSELNLTRNICTGLEVLLAALRAAGPNLTVERYIGGLQTIKGMATSDYTSVSFGPGKYAGSDFIATAQFNKDRWQPGHELFKITTPWRRMWLD